MQRYFFLGFIRIHVLHHAEKEPVYGAWIMDELARHGYHLGPGTLYPILHSLEESGYLRSEKRVVNGRVRRYYQATAKGSGALKEARRKIQELVDEVLLEKGGAR
jgi:PadR family transcriptional regulator PadR